MDQTNAPGGDDHRDASTDDVALLEPIEPAGDGLPGGAAVSGLAGLRTGLRALGGAELAVLVAVAAFTVVRSTTFTFSTTPRIGILVVLGVPGLVLLVRAAGRRDAPAGLLVGFLAAAVLSALVSGNAIHSLKGEMASWGTVVVWALALGWFAIALALGPRARSALPWAIAAGATLNGLVGLAQLAFSIERGPLATFAGRASGLMDNPVYYASFFAGVAAWAVVRAGALGGRNAIGLAAAMTFFMGLSGSRAATIALVVAAFAGVVGFRRRAALYAALAAGVGLMAASLTVSALGNSASGAVNRFETGEGIGGRAQIWRYGLEAFADRPLLGWGMNRFGAATWPRYSFEFVRDTGWDDQAQPWTDPHNIVVHLLVTVGVVGVALLVAFLAVLVRRGVDPAPAAFALGAAITWMLQPATLHVLPLLAIMLGVSRTAVGPVPAAGSRAVVTVQRSAVAVGVVLCAYVVVADYRLSRAIDSGDVDRVEAAAAWYVRDPQVTELVAARADVATAAGVADPSVAVEWATRTVALVPDDPRARGWLALRQFRAGDPDGMGRSLADALDIQEWNPSAIRLSMLHAIVTEDAGAASAAAERICALELDVCDQARADAERLAGTAD